MNCYHITSPNFSGTIEVLYINGELKIFDFTKCETTNEQKDYFKRTVPVLEAHLTEAFSNTKATIVRTDYDVTFDMFYKAGLPKRNRFRAEKSWQRLNKTDQVQAYYGIKAYLKLAGLYPVHPDTYLTEKRWEDE
jgi:DUF1680 family protein